jgi:hypothetical protein
MEWLDLRIVFYCIITRFSPLDYLVLYNSGSERNHTKVIHIQVCRCWLVAKVKFELRENSNENLKSEGKLENKLEKILQRRSRRTAASAKPPQKPREVAKAAEA